MKMPIRILLSLLLLCVVMSGWSVSAAPPEFFAPGEGQLMVLANTGFMAQPYTPWVFLLVGILLGAGGMAVVRRKPAPEAAKSESKAALTEEDDEGIKIVGIKKFKRNEHYELELSEADLQEEEEDYDWVNETEPPKNERRKPVQKRASDDGKAINLGNASLKPTPSAEAEIPDEQEEEVLSVPETNAGSEQKVESESGEIARLQDELTRSQKKWERLRSELDEVRKENEDLNQEMGGAKDALDKAKSDLAFLQTRLKTVESDEDSVLPRLKRVEAELNKTRQKLEAAQSEADKYKEELEDLQSQTAVAPRETPEADAKGLEEKIEQLKSALASEKSARQDAEAQAREAEKNREFRAADQSSEELAALRARLEQVRSEFADKNVELSRSHQQITELESQKEELEKELKASETKLGQLRTEKEELNSKIGEGSGKAEQIALLEAEFRKSKELVEKTRAQMNEVETTNAALVSELDKARTILHQIEGNRNAEQQEQTKLKGEVESLRKALEDAKGEQEQLTQTLKAKETRLAEVGGNSEKTGEALEKTQAQLSDIKAKLNSAEAEVEGLKAELAVYRPASEQTQSDLQQSQQELAEARRETADLRTENKQLKASLAEQNELSQEKDALIKAAEAKQATWTAEKTELEGKISQSEVQVKELEGKAKEFAAKLSSLESDLEASKSKADSSEKEAEKALAQVSSLEEEKAKLEAERKDHIEKFEELLSSTQEFKAESSRLVADMSKMGDDIKAKIQQMNELKSAHESALEEFEQAKVRISELEKELEVARSAPNEVEAELDKTKTHLDEMRRELRGAERRILEAEQFKSVWEQDRGGDLILKDLKGYFQENRTALQNIEKIEQGGLDDLNQAMRKGSSIEDRYLNAVEFLDQRYDLAGELTRRYKANANSAPLLKSILNQVSNDYRKEFSSHLSDTLNELRESDSAAGLVRLADLFGEKEKARELIEGLAGSHPAVESFLEMIRKEEGKSSSSVTAEWVDHLAFVHRAFSTLEEIDESGTAGKRGKAALEHLMENLFYRRFSSDYGRGKSAAEMLESLQDLRERVELDDRMQGLRVPSRFFEEKLLPLLSQQGSSGPSASSSEGGGDARTEKYLSNYYERYGDLLDRMAKMPLPPNEKNRAWFYSRLFEMTLHFNDFLRARFDENASEAHLNVELILEKFSVVDLEPDTYSVFPEQAQKASKQVQAVREIARWIGVKKMDDVLVDGIYLDRIALG